MPRPLGRLPVVTTARQPTPVGERYTIDELARLSGLTSRNIRAFQTEGMLPGPVLQGRTGYYEQRHLARITLIDRLQAQGFSRASIASLLQAWDRGRSLADVLGLDVGLPEILEADPHLRCSLESFRARMANDDEAIAEAVALRLAVIDGDEVEILNPALFDIGRDLAQAGLPLRSIMQEARRLREAADNIAHHYVDELVSQITRSLAERGASGREADSLVQLLHRLSPVITRSVDAALRQSMNDHLREVLAALSDAQAADGATA